MFVIQLVTNGGVLWEMGGTIKNYELELNFGVMILYT